jgi:hypothetical protein
LVNIILDSSYEYLDKIVNDYIKKEEDNNRIVSSSEIECIQINLISNLLKAVGNYCSSTDIIKSFELTTNGVVTINAIIIRDGKDYHFSTEMIGAGGYNIQSYHYRYLVKTNLPKSNNVLYDDVKLLMKKIDKNNKNQNLINKYQKRIDDLEVKINFHKSLTEEDFLKMAKDKYSYLVYNPDNFSKSTEEEFNIRYDIMIADEVKHLKDKVRIYEIEKKNLIKEIEKINKKFE